MYDIDQVLQDIAQRTEVDAAELRQVEMWLSDMPLVTERADIPIPEAKALVIGVHLLGLLRRIRSGEFLPELDEGMFDELSAECIEASRSLLQRCLAATGRELDDAEVFYLAVHFEAAKYTDGA